jgi:hypothetical protein
MDKDINLEELSNLIPIRLKIARMARGYKSRSDFAKACKAPITTYRAHERGDYEIKATDIIRYTHQLDISIRWLLTGAGHALEHQPEPNPETLAIFLYYSRLESSKAEIKQIAEQEATQILIK